MQKPMPIIAHTEGAHASQSEENRRTVHELASLRALVESLRSVVELQREYIGNLRSAVLAFGDSRPDGRLHRVPALPTPDGMPDTRPPMQGERTYRHRGPLAAPHAAQHLVRPVASRTWVDDDNVQS